MINTSRLGWIGVDIGTHCVKLAQAMRDSGIVRLFRAAVIQRPESWSSDDCLATEQPLASCAEIRAALECGGFVGRDAICTLPMNVSQLRGLNVPPGSDEERRTIIGDELAEDWAESRHVMEFDYWETEAARAEKSSDGFNVNVIATSRPWISQLWHDCRQTKLDCWAVDATPLAMSRAVSLVGGLGGAERVLAVDWGYSNTTVCIVGDERPLYCRRVHGCGFGLVLEGITTAFDVTRDEAQHLAETLGLSGDRATDGDATIQAAITDAAAGPLEALIRQLTRTIQFMETQRRHLQPTSIWLMGGGAAMRHVGQYLARAVPLPVHVWSIAPVAEPLACAAGSRSAVFGSAVALSAAGWRAA